MKNASRTIAREDGFPESDLRATQVDEKPPNRGSGVTAVSERMVNLEVGRTGVPHLCRQFDLDLANRRAGGTIGLQSFPVNADRFFGRSGHLFDVLARDDYCRQFWHVRAITGVVSFVVSFNDQRVCSSHQSGSLIPVCLNTAR